MTYVDTEAMQRAAYTTREAASSISSTLSNATSELDRFATFTMPELIRQMEEAARPSCIQEAIDLIVQHGGHDGEHHKAWCLDQVVRILAGPRYDVIVAEARAGEDGPETYDWQTGIAP